MSLNNSGALARSGLDQNGNADVVRLEPWREPMAAHHARSRRFDPGVFTRWMGGRLVLDVGTTNTHLFAPDSGAFFSQPTVLIVDSARGIDAQQPPDVPFRIEERMRGRLPGSVRAVRPIEGGLIADAGATQMLLRQFIGAARAAGLVRGNPKVTLCVPGCSDLHERLSWRRALAQAGLPKSALVEKPLAAAVAVGIAPTDTMGSLLLDIGGGSTEISVIAQGYLLRHARLPVAGEAIDRAIIRYVRDAHGLYLGEQTAEDVKKQLGCGYAHVPVNTIRVTGKAMIDGIPRSVDVSIEALVEVIRGEVQRIMAALRGVLESMSAELLADVIQRGVMVIGGTAMLPGLGQAIWEGAGLQSVICSEPATCSLRGSLRASKVETAYSPSSVGSRRWPWLGASHRRWS